MLRLSEIAGLFSDKKITPVPSRVTTLLGIAGFRGTVLPVYDLHAFLGPAMTKPPRWLVVAANAPLALAFEELDGHLQISSKDVLPRERSRQERQYVHDFAHVQDLVRPILHLPSILDAIRQQQAEQTRERER
jgi:purine-binding chemotaxis protein CheW